MLMRNVTEEKVLELASKPEGFRVGWLWRDDRLMNYCVRMKKAGKLTSKQGRGETRFYASN